MHQRLRAAWHRLFLLARREMSSPHASVGKITIFAVVFGALVLSLSSAVFQVNVPEVRADDVQTSVTVLNTPPQWTVDAQESTESSTTTPTNSGQVISWTGRGTDSNSDDYWLIICKTGAAPTPNVGAPPSCNGGISNRWAISATTTSAASSTAATTTIETFPFNAESNAWYAFICDANITLPQCNLTAKQGSGTTVSPFVVNHPPVFSAISNDSPENPGGTVTWTSTASDGDTIRGGDTVTLVVCKANDFNSTTGYCGAGGTWATSTAAASNPATTTTLATVLQDTNYAAYVHIYDQNTHMATSSFQNFNSQFTVNNVAPSVSAGTVNILGATSSTDMLLVTPASTSGPFSITFTVTDNNSCLNASSTNEISVATSSIYRSGIGQSACQVSAHYDTNSCYPSANSQTLFSCTQTGACGGSSDPTIEWTCTFPLWFNADPTDAGSFYAAENWKASVQTTDDDGLLSPVSESTTGSNELLSFLAFNVVQTAIPYGGLQPGQSNDPLSPTTTLQALGNTGVDEDVYGDTMCRTTVWNAPDSCDAGGIDPSQEIPVGNQKVATSGVAYASGATLTSSTSPLSMLINVLKTVSTSSIQSKETYWGIQIPIAITVAGDYEGQNTITAKKSNSAFWY